MPNAGHLQPSQARSTSAVASTEREPPLNGAATAPVMVVQTCLCTLYWVSLVDWLTRWLLLRSEGNTDGCRRPRCHVATGAHLGLGFPGYLALDGWTALAICVGPTFLGTERSRTPSTWSRVTVRWTLPRNWKGEGGTNGSSMYNITRLSISVQSRLIWPP